MKRHLWIGAFVVALIAGSRGPAGGPQCCEASRDPFLKRVGPVGGWHPYGGSLIRWWNPCCFPRCGAPDDYCRKPLPSVCWLAYPSYYLWGPPEICAAHGDGPRGCNKPH